MYQIDYFWTIFSEINHSVYVSAVFPPLIPMEAAAFHFLHTYSHMMHKKSIESLL